MSLANLQIKCPQCDKSYLIPGYAIDRLGQAKNGGGRRSTRPCYGYNGAPLSAENIEIVFVLKCPTCGHNEELSWEDQDILKNNVPPGYSNWNQYWAAEKKILPNKWLRNLK